MKFLFAVQGEGRGHMTQAIALQNMMLRHGHEVCAVVIGKSEHREVPAFFYSNIKAEITVLESPYLATGKDNKSISISKTLSKNMARSRIYWKNVKKLDALIQQHKPDAVINFYEFLCGFYFRFFNPGLAHICIAHQFLLEHPDFVFPEGVTFMDKFWYFSNTYISSSRATKKLALSFREMRNIENKKIYVVPPLLRQEVLDTETSTQDYLLVYMVNAGFSNDVIAWHKSHSDVKIHLFCDRKDIEDETVFNGSLTVHRLNDKKFLEKMKNCKAYASTSGFESVCEAMYMGKPILLVPPQGHFEQKCNALDAEISGAGIQHTSFDIQKLIGYLPHYKNKDYEKFRAWVNSADGFFSRHLFVKA